MLKQMVAMYYARYGEPQQDPRGAPSSLVVVPATPETAAPSAAEAESSCRIVNVTEEDS